jgi:hypothetical protein
VLFFLSNNTKYFLPSRVSQLFAVSPLLVGYECWRKFFDSLDFSWYVRKTVNYPGGAVVGLVDQQPKRTTKKLQLKIVSFINGNLSHILASVLHQHV